MKQVRGQGLKYYYNCHN